jgi:hypothetical protein
MKKILFSMLLPLLGLWACDKEAERPGLTTSEIALLIPSNHAAFDLENTLNIPFAWEEAFLVDNYELVFSNNEDLSNPNMVNVRRTPHLITSSDMNDIAAKAGIQSGYAGEIYWTVRSGKSSQPSVAEVRSLTVTRLAAQPLTPAKDTVITLDHTAPDTEITFSWEAMPVDDYQLIISANADLSDPLMETTVSATSAPVTYQTLQDFIDDPANGLKRYKSNTLYWNVQAGDKILARPSWKFKLAGARIFTDVRGDESITYQVSVVPNGDDEELVWMSENLRATKLVDGTPLVYEGQEDWDSQYFPAEGAKTSASALVPEGISRHAGVYYRVQKIGDNSSSVQWPALLAPAGWKVPEVQDFLNLVTAALRVSPTLEVLRHPDGFPTGVSGGTALDETLMNLWNMNMVPCGSNRITGGGSLYVAEFAALGQQHMLYAFNSVTQVVTVETLYPKGGNARAIGLGTNAPVTVRLLYTGDD